MAATFFADTSCIIAAICGWHESHRGAAREFARRLGARERMATAAHAVAEAYAVLTRLPSPHRLAPADAMTLLEANVLQGAQIVALGAGVYRSVLRRAASEGVSGGRIYDALIGECARKSGAAALLTFNARHFAHLEADGIELVVPSAE